MDPTSFGLLNAVDIVGEILEVILSKHEFFSSQVNGLCLCSDRAIIYFIGTCILK